MTDKLTRYGFTFGPLVVERLFSIRRRPSDKGDYRAVAIKTPHRELHIYASPTGRSLRVFDQAGRELR